MKRDERLARSLLVACATFALSAALNGCGADDSAATTSSSATSSSASPSQGVAANEAMQQRAPTLPALVPNASEPLAAFAANPASASDPVEQTMQANLAADNQQIAPVMHYAPGDHASSN